MKQKILKLITSATLVLAFSATAFATNLDNIKFGEDEVNLEKLTHAKPATTTMNQYAYSHYIQFHPEDILDSKVDGVEYNCFKTRLYRVDIAFHNNTEKDFERITQILTKKYGKPATTNFSGKTFLAKSSEWEYKGNHYDLRYYRHNTIENDNSLNLVINTNYYIPDEKDAYFNNYNPKTPKSYDDLKIFK